MKKSLLIAAAVAMSFVACSKEEIQTVSKGMTLSANVADDNTKATITKKEGTIKWNFFWELNDVVNVTSPSDGNPSYDFTYDGTSFKCETAIPAPGKWSAVYPKSYTTNGISFLNQDGTLESAMEKYLLTGSCTSDGSAKLLMPMEPKFAILKINNTTGEDRWFTICNKVKKIFPTSYSEGIVRENTTSTLQKDCEIGTVGAGKTSYYIVPTGSYYLYYAKTTTGKIDAPSGVYDKGPKKLEAGYIYNVTF